MSKKLKKSIFGIFILSMMLFLFACEKQEIIIEQPHQFQLIFDTAGGSNMETIYFESGSSVELPNIVPNKAGYEFDGWDKNLPSTMPASDVILIAQWNPLSYTINFDTDGGTEVESITKAYLSPLEMVEIPTKVGYTFNGWSPSLPDQMPLDGLEVKATWLLNTYTMTFDTAGGSLIESIIAPYNESIQIPDNPTRSGYIFKGWNQPIPEKMPAANLVITAEWELIPVLNEDVFLENFESLQGVKDSGGNFSSYEDMYFIGNTYVYWELINVRIDIGMKQGGNAITIGGFGNEYGDAGMGRIYGEEIFDGIQSLEFDARLPFSPKSTYPQVNGNDKAQNARIKVFINGVLVETLQFLDDDQANKGTTFKLDNLNVVGTFSLSIEISSGHRLTIDNLKWQTNKNGQVVEPEPEVELKQVTIDFEDEIIDFDYTESMHSIGGMNFMLKEVHTKTMHPDKELDYMTYETHGNVVARFRGNSGSIYSTEIAYMYNVDPMDYVSTLSMDARLFGADTYFDEDSIINIYYKTTGMLDFELIETLSKLNEVFTNYEIEIDKENVHIKIEVLHGSVNIDNITFVA